MKKIYIDVETTGLDPEKNGIIQIAGIIEIGEGVPPVPFTYDIRPFHSDLVKPEALDKNRKSLQGVMAYPEAKGVHKLFTKMLGAYVDKFDSKDKFLFIGYNAGFDSDCIRAWMEKCGDKFYGSFFWHPPIDIMALAGWVLQDERSAMPDFKLATVARQLGISFDEESLHDALVDIELTKQIESALNEKIHLQQII